MEISSARKDMRRLKRLVDQMTSRRTLGDHARFGVFLQRYAGDLVHAVREKAMELMEGGETEQYEDDGVMFIVQRREGKKPQVHIHFKEDRAQ